MSLQVAAALALGAPGVVIGTRFAVTTESMLSDEKKQRYVAAKAADTRRTRLYDDLGSLNWPKGIDGRIIGNDFSNRHGTAAPVEVRPRSATGLIHHGCARCHNQEAWTAQSCLELCGIIPDQHMRRSKSSGVHLLLNHIGAKTWTCRSSSARQSRKSWRKGRMRQTWMLCRCGAGQAWGSSTALRAQRAC